MKLTSVRLNPDALEAISKLYETTTEGIQKSINLFLELRKPTLYSLKGRFTRQEIIAMADSLNGTIMEERFMVNQTTAFAGFEDSEKFDSTFTRNGADFDAFQKKFFTLTPAESFFLLEEISRFWNVEKAYGSPTPDLEKLISTLAGK